jgi:hypothetical protein
VFNHNGEIVREKTLSIELPVDICKDIPVAINIPDKPGGYLLVAEFTPENQPNPIISRRYIKVGALDEYRFYKIK